MASKPTTPTLADMKEDLTPLGKIRSRISRLEQSVNASEFEYDSLGVLQSVKDSVPALIKLQQPIVELFKKIQGAFCRAEDMKKALSELKSRMKDFHTEIAKSGSQNGEVHTRQTSETLAECSKIKESIAKLENTLSAAVKTAEEKAKDELQKLLAEVLQIVDSNKDKAMHAIYEKDKAFWGEMEKLRAELEAAKARVNEKRPKETTAGIEKLEQLVKMEVVAEFEKLLEDFADKLSVKSLLVPPLSGAEKSPKAPAAQKSLEAIQAECDKFTNNVTQEINSIRKHFEEFLENYLSAVELGTPLQDSFDTVAKFQNRVEALGKIVKETTARRIQDLDHLSKTAPNKDIVAKFANKAAQIDNFVERKLSHLQSRLETCSKRIQGEVGGPLKVIIQA